MNTKPKIDGYTHATARKILAMHKSSNSERRFNERLPIEVSAVINYDMHALIGTVRDISANGCFIEADPTELPLRHSLELSMSVQSRSGETRCYRLPVVIRRVTENGAAVSFNDLGREMYFTLAETIPTRQ
ncbi:MAG: PilZ domain-containing protein [Pseudomonadota bacterium]